MSQVNTSSNDKNVSPIASFLSSLNASQGSGTGLSNLFDSLLATTQAINSLKTTGVSPSATLPAATAVAKPAATGFVANTGLNALHDVMAELRNFAEKFNAQFHPHHDDNGPSTPQTPRTEATNNSNSSSSNSGNSNTTSSNASPAVTSASPASDTSSTTATGTTTDTTTTQDSSSLSDLLAQMQTILRALQKQMQAATGTTNDGTDGTDSTVTDDVAKAAQDMLAAAGAMADLLTLAQMMQKKLGANAPTDGTTNTNTDPNAAVDPNLVALDTQLRANVKNLMDTLQKAATTNAPATNDSTTTDTVDTALANGQADLTKVTSDAVKTVADASTTANDVIKGAQQAAEDFLKQLNSIYGSQQNTTDNFVASVKADAVASVANADTPSDNGGANAFTSGSGNAAQPAPQAALSEGTKAANPYNFASQLSAVRAQLGGLTGLQSPVEQVLLQLNRNAKTGNDQMSIQLHPADLGTVNVKLNFSNDGSVSGTIIASNADTLSMLQKDSRSLERALQDAGLNADSGSLSFSLGDPSNSNKGGNANSGFDQSASNGNLANDGALSADNEIDTTTSSWVVTPGRVNIQV